MFVVMFVVGCPRPPAGCTENADCPDDGLYCNGAEVCTDGACAHAGDPCPTGTTCNDETNHCDECDAAADCDDADACTDDACTDAECVNTAVDCGAEFCDPATGDCVACLVDADCDDGAFCNGAETCADMACVAGTAPCDPAAEICDEGLDACTAIECATDADCDDGMFCNGGETCVGQLCTNGTAPCAAPTAICLEDTDACVECEANEDCGTGFECVANVCEEVVTGCTEDTECDDSNLCTDDVCTDGECSNTAVDCDRGQHCDAATGDCVEITGCTSNADCDDGASCSTDICVLSTGECAYTDIDASCDDGLYCTGGDPVADVCDPTDPDAGDDGCVRGGNPCSGFTPVCDETNDECDACTSDAQCDDGFSCTADVCNTGTGGCTRTPSNSACNDGLWCTATDTCEPLNPDAGDDGCVHSPDSCGGKLCNEDTDTCDNCTTDAQCDDGILCTYDNCKADGTCENVPEATRCPDPDFCDGEDVCDPGHADADANGCVQPGNPCDNPTPICNETDNACVICESNAECEDWVGLDAVPCTKATCDPAGECGDTNWDPNCDDDVFCNGPETCDPLNGAADADGCVVGVAPTCDDAVACTDDSCNAGTDECEHTDNCGVGLSCLGGADPAICD